MEPQEPHPSWKKNTYKNSHYTPHWYESHLYFHRGITELPSRWYSLFKTNIHRSIYRPVHQSISWLAVTSSALQCSQRRLTSKSNIINANQLLLSIIFTSRLITYLSSFETFPPFRTVVGPDQTLYLCIKIEDDPHYFQDTENDICI